MERKAELWIKLRNDAVDVIDVLGGCDPTSGDPTPPGATAVYGPACAPGRPPAPSAGAASGQAWRSMRRVSMPMTKPPGATSW